MLGHGTGLSPDRLVPFAGPARVATLRVPDAVTTWWPASLRSHVPPPFGPDHNVGSANRHIYTREGRPRMADDEKAQAAFDNFVQLWTTGTTAGRRAPVLRRPDEVRLEYENVTFPSMDGVPLEGWFIPADSDKLIIHNHFLPGNRYGYPGHLPEFGGLGGFEVSFLPEY